LPGQYFNTSSGSCVSGTAGSIITRLSTYFFDNSTYTLPSAFGTICSGLCGSNGWRVFGTYADSGFHLANEVDSSLILDLQFNLAGYVNFSYVVSVNNSNSGLQLLVDGTLQQLPVIPASFTAYTLVQVPLTAGSHQLIWNYHQEIGSEGSVQLSNVVLVGDVTGQQTLSTLTACPAGSYATSPASTVCTPCAAGNFSSNPGSTSCGVCPVNTFAAQPGQGSCQACGVGTYTTGPGSQHCLTTCVFSPFAPNSTQTYNLTALGTTSFYDNTRNLYTINVCQQLTNPSCANSYACAEALDGTYTQLGTSVQIIPLNASSPEPFSISLSHGPPTAQCANGTAANINFLCDPDAGVGAPTFVSNVNCIYSFEWVTSSGCPVCQTTDYLTVTGVCAGGARAISSTRQSACNGPSSVDIPSESCSSAEFPTGAVVGVVIAFVVVVAVAGFIFWRNRRLSTQYSQLRARSSSISSDTSPMQL
jgi:hypothetical protein